jgi:hypothetical protein
MRITSISGAPLMDVIRMQGQAQAAGKEALALEAAE